MSTQRVVVANGDFHTEGLKGSPSWSQLVDITFGNPYYIPNPSIITAASCLLACLIVTIWAAFTTHGRKNKVSNPITQYFFGWPRSRYWITMIFALTSFSWAVFDDSFRLVNAWAEQRLFLAQFVFDAFWDFTRIFLLWNTYDLLFHLMRYAPLGQGSLCKVHFWRYEIVRQAICGVLFLLAFVMMCMRISYLTGVVFHPPSIKDQAYLQYDVVQTVAVALCFLRDILYLVANLEVLVVSGVLLERKRSRDGSSSKAAYVHTLVWITSPIFLAGIFAFISTCIRPPPLPNLWGSSNDSDLSLAAVQFTASIFGGFGVVLPLAGLVMVSKRMDALTGKGERLTSESTETIDVLLMARNLGRSDAYPASLMSDGERPGTVTSNYEVRIVGGSNAV